MNSTVRRLLLTLVITLCTTVLFAQRYTITGTVYDGETGDAIPGATIVEKGTQNGTTTGIDGKYVLNVTSGSSTIVVSFIGYEKQELPVNQLNRIDVRLKVESTNLSEIVVIGYGTQRKKVVTGAIEKVSGEEVLKTPVLRVEQALQGRTAGVQVTNLSGQPGEAPTIKIRGTGTTGDYAPLYVVDGISVGGIDYLNPGDIESMEVLKDAASAAIYGARAANGVVLITTKSGKAGKMNISYSGYRGFQNVAKKLDMLNAEEYKMMMNEGARNNGETEPFDLNEISPYDTDWQSLIFEKNAPMQSHDISVSGGNEKSTYLSSLNYFTQDGIIGGEKSSFERVTARLNTTHQVNKRLRFGNNLSYSYLSRRGISSNTAFNGAYSSALNLDPLTPLYMEDSLRLDEPPYSIYPVVRNSEGKYYAISDLVRGEVVNPVALLETQTAKTRVDKIVGNIFGELEFIKGLKFITNFGIDLAYVLNDSHRPLFYLTETNNNTEKTSVSKDITRYFTWQWENTLSYNRKIKDHNFTILGGTSALRGVNENLYGFNAGVPIYDPEHVYLNMATDTAWVATGGANQHALYSTFGRLLYDYRDKYAFTAIIRRDGSTRFGENNRYGIFPSLGVSWVVSDESFFPKLNWVSALKFRASWGINGNENIGDYQYLSLMDKSRGYIIGGGRMTGSSPLFLENADIKWEESEQIDIAMDFNLFNDRLITSVDYYVKTTNGLLERIPIPGHVGNEPPYANVGSVENRGVEFSTFWRHVVNDLKYSVGVNAAYNKNTMTHIGNSEKILPGAGWAIAGMVTRSMEGLPIGYFYGYQTDGIFQTEDDVFVHDNDEGLPLQPNAKPGDVIFVDVNNDGVINPDDRTMIGNPNPDWTFGFNGTAEYKNFDLSFLFTGTYGNDIFNGSQRQDLKFTNRTTKILDRWTGPGTSNEVPIFTSSDSRGNYKVSDLYIEDGSYLRLKNIQIGYSMPISILQRVGATVFRVYVSAENLLTLTKYTGADPEIGAISTFDIGIDRGIYPQARTFRVGTTITF